MKLIFCFLLLTSISLANKGALFDEFSKINATKHGLEITLKQNDAKRLFKLGEQNERLVKGGDSVLISYGEIAYLVRKHEGVYFDPLPNKTFKITRRFDARSFGGKLKEDIYLLNFNSDDQEAEKIINSAKPPTETLKKTPSSLPSAPEVIAEITAPEPAIEEPAEVVVAAPIEEEVEPASNWWLWLVGAVVVVGGVLLVRRKK